MSKTTPRLEHAFLYVSDLGATLAYYERLFPSWSVRWEGRSKQGNRWVHFGPPGEGQPGYLSLFELPGAKEVEEQVDAVYVAHIGFAHDDVSGMRARLAKQHIYPSDEVEADGYRRVYYADPDGHQLEFVEQLA